MNRHSLRNYFIAGLLVWIPIWVTWVMISFIIATLDQTLAILPESFHRIWGLGVILSFAIVIVTGVIATNFFGKRLVALWEAILNRIPFVRSIYKAVKQVMETLFSSNSNAFRKVLLVEYPREGLWSLAFQTSTIPKSQFDVSNDDLVAIFIPTTPNPTSGFMMMVPKSNVVEMDMTVDEAFKMIISLGVMQPKFQKPPLPR